MKDFRTAGSAGRPCRTRLAAYLPARPGTMAVMVPGTPAGPKRLTAGENSHRHSGRASG